MICFCWAGFPQYAARLIGHFVRSTGEEVVVVANRPRVPVEGMEKYAQCRLVWVPVDESRSLVDVVGKWPEHFFVNGWFTPLFNRFREQARDHGAHVYAMVDNSFTGTFKDYLRAVRFRFCLRGKFDGFLVPGRNGVKMMRRYGVSVSKVQCGMYSADDDLFSSKVPILNRPKRMLFVGRFVPLKNLERVCRAFLEAGGPEKGWSLELRGCGPCKDHYPRHSNILIEDFVQPENLPQVYMGARVFVLASHYDHWGLVVHEAALSGCTLLLSNQVGASDDFLSEGVNGFSFNPWKYAHLLRAMRNVFDFTDEQFAAAEKESIRLAHENAGKDRFVVGVTKLVKGE